MMAETTSLRDLESLSASPEPEMPLTISPSDTSLDSPEPVDDDMKEDEKKPTKKRKSWGQELPVPKTNLPPRKRAKTEDEKEQRRIERVLRNRAAAQTSRERKRLEMEKLETEKIRMEQQNQFLLQRLQQMEAENTRLSQQVAQLSAEVRGSRSSTPVKAGSPVPNSSATTTSPTLTPTLFKQEGEELQMERIPFPTPSTITLDYSPTLKPSTLAEATTDVTQHPAAMLCSPDLQCPSAASKEQALSLSSTSNFQFTLATTLQLLFLTMTSVASSTVTFPLLRILHSLKTGSPLALSTAEIYQHFPLIHWLISTPSLSPSTVTGPSFRMRLLTRLLACSPALARPLRDATGRALQLAVREQIFSPQGTVSATSEGRSTWMSLLTMAWAIDIATTRASYGSSFIIIIIYVDCERGRDWQDTISGLFFWPTTQLRKDGSISSTSTSTEYTEFLEFVINGYGRDYVVGAFGLSTMVRRDPIFEARTNVKLHSNRLKKEASRAEATFKSEKAKADRAMKAREFQIARIHASSAVREKRRQVTLRAEAARADVIINELKAAQSTRDTSRTLALASRGLDAASKSVNLESLVAHANNFLARSEDFKIAGAAIEDVAAGISMAEYGAEGEGEVDALMGQLADDAGVEWRMALEDEAGKVPEGRVQEPKVSEGVPGEVEDGLGARLRALRAAN
ncbi:uncharacterized protein N7473_008944 [Penicillium subrubescens]|nr:uncharacterized protein N7473_008944 [Penicillium subrubescens]KAJ5886270.1 hypothetical protein N7473_008944 [Penicillium subrubescens]